jgi:hypothetical protein
VTSPLYVAVPDHCPVALLARVTAFCGEEIFGFEKVNGAYKFTDIGMND